MKPGMKPDNFRQIYEKGMKPGMKPRYETGLPEKESPIYMNFQISRKLVLVRRETIFLKIVRLEKLCRTV